MSRTSYFAPGVYVEEVPSAQQPIAGVGTNVVGFIGIVPSKIYIPVANPRYDPVMARAKLERDALDARLQKLAGTAGVDQGAIDALTEQKRKEDEKLAASLERLREDQKQKDAAAKEARSAADALNAPAATAGTALKAAVDALKTASDADKAELTAKRDAAKAANDDAKAKLHEATSKADALEQEAKDLQAAIDNASKSPESDAAGAEAEQAPAGNNGADNASKNPGDLTSANDAKKFDFPDPDDISALLTPSFLQPFMLQEFIVSVDPFDTKFCTNFTDYTRRFGTFSAYNAHPDEPRPANPDNWVYSPLFAGHHALTHAVNGFFRNGGTKAYVARIENAADLEKALEKFKSIDDLAIIVAPGLPRNKTTWEALISYGEEREDCFAILDCPEVINSGKPQDFDFDIQQLDFSNPASKEVLPRVSKMAAYYVPHIEVADPAKQLQDSDPQRRVSPKYQGLTYVPPSGHIAGIYARMDTERGVHKAPANCVVRGAQEVRYYISKPMQEQLNPQGVNAIRIMNGAVTVWGARTVGGDANSEWKYISVRRLFLYLKKSIEEGTQWIVFEPNDEALWGKIRLNITAFLTNVWRSGALFGTTPEQAFYVKCDAELNPPEVRDLGQVITEIGVAIVRPAEFVIFRITQSTGIGQT
ncbi:Phage tail sheath protein FI (plasmid) [Paraburkholderia caribensis MBA4]|uniref:Phage tail sheath protein FI n=1 Tax=Paraburkholderia caribensis MBA4 TaxID=1323664 RepID=A0A0P0RPV8_9BURK|nr:Phage tail sheath protein FI [Paraburkholderia caribensis MBA4]